MELARFNAEAAVLTIALTPDVRVVAGDGAGVSRGLIQASASGVIVAQEIMKREEMP